MLTAVFRLCAHFARPMQYDITIYTRIHNTVLQQIVDVTFLLPLIQRKKHKCACRWFLSPKTWSRRHQTTQRTRKKYRFVYAFNRLNAVHSVNVICTHLPIQGTRHNRLMFVGRLRTILVFLRFSTSIFSSFYFPLCNAHSLQSFRVMSDRHSKQPTSERKKKCLISFHFVRVRVRVAIFDYMFAKSRERARELGI